MNRFNSKIGAGVAAGAAAMSVICAVFVPYGYPWPTVAWALLAGAAVVGMDYARTLPAPTMSDVIRGVEKEQPKAGRNTP